MNAVQWVQNKPETKRRVQWLGRPVFGVGATEAEMIQIKTLLASWAQTDGAQSTPFPNYGTQAQDLVLPFTKLRDGIVLEAFSVWWNSGQKPPHLVTGVVGEGGIVSAIPDAPHLQALQNWAAGKGSNPILNPPQQPPLVTDLSTCLQQCQLTSGFDPISLAMCSANCAQKYPLSQTPPELPPPQVTPPPQQPPPQQPPPSTPPPQPPPMTTAAAETKTNYVPWILGGLAVLGIGALVVAGGR